jgi:hypothetical protein
VWKQLEEQNPSFFQEYYKALAAQVTIAFAEYGTEQFECAA